MMEVNEYRLGAMPLDIAFVDNVEVRARLREAVRTLERCIISMFSLRGVYDDMGRCKRMVGMYPKNRRPMPRSDYLHLTWMLFINLCYLLEERAKSFGACFNRMARVYGVGRPIDVGLLVKRIRKDLSEQIRARGELTHEAMPGHERIIEYATLELLHKLGHWPEEFPKHEKIYGITKILVEVEMNMAITKAKAILAETLSDAGNNTADAIVKFNTLFGALKRQFPPPMAPSPHTHA
jgi:hypothetical protein